MRMKKSSGFTLIELVIVVVILGFLAVTAIPKFIDLTEQAKQANIEGMAGGFATAISLARAQWEADGRPQVGTQNSVDYDGITLVLTTETTTVRPGYVTGLTDGDALGGGFDSVNCVEIWNNILQQPPRITNSISTLNSDSSMRYYASESGDVENSTCHYYLKESLDRNTSGVYLAPTPVGSTSTGNSFTYQPATSAVTVYITDI
jgi:MSHA pilin protein MshB